MMTSKELANAGAIYYQRKVQNTYMLLESYRIDSEKELIILAQENQRYYAQRARAAMSLQFWADDPTMLHDYQEARCP